MLKRPYLLTVVASFLVFVGLGWSMIRASAPTFDEALHLSSGYTCLVNGPPCLGYEGHPPFARKWAALSLLALRPKTFFDHPHWLGAHEFNYADLFLYGNSVPPDTLLDTARLWCLLSWSLPLAIGILEWSLRAAGIPGLVAGGLLFAFCPPLISNLSLVTTDGASSVLFFMTVWLFSLKPRSLRGVLAAGGALGLALASKFNMVVLPAFVGACLWLEARFDKRAPRLAPAHAGAACLAAAAAVCLACSLGGLEYYWRGLRWVFTLVREGRASFMFGSHSPEGHRLYFPIALAVKTPIPLLLVSAVGFFLSARRRPADIWAILPPLAYFAATGISKTQIGYRHILPVYPFMVLWGAVGAAWMWERSRGWRVAAALLGCWLVAGVLGVHPDYLAYFNESVGGPSQGYRCLVDSNLDWGQGLKELAAELRRRGNPPIVFSYFGNGDPAFYGIRYAPLAFTSMADRIRTARTVSDFDPVLFAVSATNLQGVYFQNQRIFDWLRWRRPVFVAGHSIFLYDLTDDPEGSARFAAILSKNGLPVLGARLMRRAPLPRQWTGTSRSINRVTRDAGKL